MKKRAAKRRYESPLRRQQAAETRERILTAAVQLVHRSRVWNWRLTFGAVGQRAGVSVRTVHRHFRTERRLREAVIERLCQESGVPLEGFDLSDFAEVARRTFSYLASFAVAPAEGPVDDPSFAAIDRRRREGLMGAVRRATPKWPQAEREMVAAVLDMLWNVPPYERLITAWRLEPERAIHAMTWVIGLIEDAIRQGRRPGR